VTSEEIFDEAWMQDRTDLRLTLDEADDYELLREVYNRVEYEDTLPIRDVVSATEDVISEYSYQATWNWYGIFRA
jgi:spore coat polysaccharide biosynthesis protein SpsF